MNDIAPSFWKQQVGDLKNFFKTESKNQVYGVRICYTVFLK